MAGEEPRRPWSPKPIPTKGDADPNVTYAAVGRALSQWSRYETALARLFAAFIALDRDSESARRAFASVRTFEGRIEMVSAAAEVYFMSFPSGDLEDRWKAVKRAGKEFGTRRNEIAHGEVADFFPYAPDSDGQPLGVCLFPAQVDSKRRDVFGRPAFAYDAAAVDYYAAEFAKLAEAPELIRLEIIIHALASL